MAVGTGIALALGGAGVLSYLGAREQAKALRAAGKHAEAAEMERIAIMRELMEEDKPVREQFRKAALSALPGIEADLNREPGTGQLFQTGLRRGTEAIMRELAPFGLTESKVTGQAIGDLSEGLLSQDIESIREGRFRLAGFAPSTLPAAVGFGTQAAGLNQLQTGLMSQSPMAGFYGDLSSVAGTMGTLRLLKTMKF